MKKTAGVASFQKYRPRLSAVKMNAEQIIPSILMIFYVISAGIYFAKSDWKRGAYWAACVVLTWSVNF